MQMRQLLRSIVSKALFHYDVAYQHNTRADIMTDCVLEEPSTSVKPGADLHVDLQSQLVWKSIMVSKGAVKLSGLIWQLAGFEVGQPLKVSSSSEALVVQACDKAEMSFVLEGKTQAQAAHTFDLRGTVVDNSFVVRAVVLENLILLVTPMTALGKQCRPDREWPTSRAKLEFLTRVASERTPRPTPVSVPSECASEAATAMGPVDASTPFEAPAVIESIVDFEERNTYEVAPGSRLQVQGNWLPALGFTAGTKFSLKKESQMLELTVDDNGSHTVTEHSPGRSKLYVAAANLKELNSEKVRVLAKAGVIRLLPVSAT